MQEVERGAYLRFIRESQKKTQNDLAGGNLSRATIGNIELAAKNVTEDTVKEYCKRLKVNYDDLPQLIIDKSKKDQEERNELIFKLNTVEDFVFLTNPNLGSKQLKKLLKKLALIDSLSYRVEYLHGIIQLNLGKFDKARHHFLKALKLSNGNADDFHPNIYNQLGRTSFFQNNFDESLKYTDLGIRSLRASQKERKHVLLMNKVIYLERIDRINESLDILHDLWKEKEAIENIEVLLNMHDVKGAIYKKKGLLYAGLDIIKKGIQLARLNVKINRSVALWTTLGDIYIALNKYADAEFALETAISLGGKDHNLLFPTKIKQGELYTLLGEYDKATQILETALSDKGKVNISRLIQKYIALGDVFFTQNKFNEAIQHFNDALATAKAHHLVSYQNDIYKKLGICWKSMDQSRYTEMAVKHFETHLLLTGGVSE